MKLSKATLFVIILLAAVVIIKFIHLSLPFYWDEAWAFGPAVYTMYHHGLSLFPDAIPTDLSRGHPLLFHFTAALWMKIFGTGVFSLHCFALTIALAFLIVIFRFGKNIFSTETGIIATLLMSVQAIFLAQASLLLFEIFLSLWIILSIQFYLKGRYLLYALTASLALLTKETAVTLIASIFIFHLVQRKNIRSYIYLLIPLLPFLGFLILQKHYHGWYLFPEHIGYLNFSPMHIGDIMENYFSLIFIYYGRNVILFTALISLAYVLIKKNWRNAFNNSLSNHALILLSLFMAVFICFGGINYYSDRYAMPLLAPFLLFTSYIIERSVQKKTILYPVVFLFVFINAYYSYSYKTTSDNNLGYLKYCRIQKQCVDYFIANKWQDKNICATFIMGYYLTNSYSGYVTEENKMRHVDKHFTEQTELVVTLSSENYDKLDEKAMQEKWIPVKIFSEESAVIKVFSKSSLLNIK